VAKPRAASQRVVLAVAPRRAARRRARSRSGWIAASEGSMDSGSTPSRSSLNLIAASPRPRSASAAARPWANRSSSSAPCRRSAVTLGIGWSLLRLGRLLLGGHFDRSRQQPSGDHLVRPGIGLDLRQDLLGHVRVLAQERGRVLAALAESLVAEAEVRARLRD